MANATVDKLKNLGLRHGEKIVVGLVSLLCVWFLFQAFTTETIKTTPDEVKKAAQTAQSNINAPATKEDIEKKLGDEEVAVKDFLALVEKNKPGTVSAEQYQLVGDFVSPEPGAGLLRGMPELIAPGNLLARAQRGSTMMFVLDEEGNRKIKEVKDDQPRPKRKKKSRRGGMAGGSMMGGMPGMGGARKKKKTGNLAKEEAKRREEREEKRKQALLAGEDVPTEEPEEEEVEGEEEQGLVGLRLVSIVGELDHKKLRENYAKALKVGVEAAQPHYLRLDLQRQEMNDDGTWPDDWQTVDREANQLVLDNITEQEEELTPEDVRIEGLVDMLPFFRSGYWRAVHLTKLVPAEKKAKPKPKKEAAGYAGMGGYGMGSGMMGSGGGGYPGMGGGGGYPGMGGSGGAGGRYPGMGGSGGSGMMGSGGGRYPGMAGSGGAMMGSAGAGGPADTGFAQSSADKLMVRSLDFTVAPDTTYRFRVRLVVRNPNYQWELVMPGVDTKTEELPGPWSEPTGPISVPADVSTYAVDMLPSDANPAGDKVNFLVARWTPDDGLTVNHSYIVGPGEIIGEYGSVQAPDSEGKKLVTKRVDFTSGQLMLDALGGTRSLDRLDLNAARFDAPTQALVIRPDGALVLRDEARDKHSGEIDEMKSIYDEARKEVEKGTKKATGSSAYPGMGSGMMGGGGGYPGMGGGRRGGR